MQTSGRTCREIAKLYPRHCERSEAIHAATKEEWIASLARHDDSETMHREAAVH
jgi:hypothetical protein